MLVADNEVQQSPGRGMVAEVSNEVGHEVGVQSSRSLDRGLPCGIVSVFGMKNALPRE